MENLIFKILATLCYASLKGSGQLIRDARCFLENGAAAAHLFVSEDLKVGDIVGVLNVFGDPGSQGDIELRLQEHDSPVNFSPYSRNLTLLRPLDKEGIEGPASVYINVICEKKHALDPGFVIPINIRVTDVNDNAPEFINAPYLLNISEVTVVGTRVLQGVRALDADQPGSYSTVQYSILAGSHADIFIFSNPLEGTLILRKSLDYETLTNFTVNIRAQDQGSPPLSTITTLCVNVIDADDQNPAFLNDQYKINIPLQLKAGKNLKVNPAPIKAVDKDMGIRAPIKYSIQSGSLPFLSLNSETADLVAIRSLQNHELISSATFVIKATQIDNPDRYTLATVIVARQNIIDDNFTNDITAIHLPIRFILKDYHASIAENTPISSVILKAGVNKIDSNLKFCLIGANEDLKKFFINDSGEIILRGNLDYELRIQHSFLACVTDKYNNDTTKIHISVKDVNEWEPRFRYPRYEFHARSLREGSIVVYVLHEGRLEVADGDRGDRVSLAIRGPDTRSFEIHDNGELILRSMETLNGSIARLVAIASDTGTPPRTSMVPVLIHLPHLGIMPVAAKASPAWLGSSILLVAIFGAILGLLGVIILILILYIYKHKGSKNGESVSSVGTGYREKSPVPSALSSTPQILGASILQDRLEITTDKSSESNDINNPVFQKDNDSYNTIIRSIVTTRAIPYSRHKVAPVFKPPALSASSNIPNVDDLVQNMNDLSSRNIINNIETGSQNSSDFSKDPPNSLIPTWPAEFLSRKVKKLSWDDDDRTMDNSEMALEAETKINQSNNEHLNLTVYF